MEALKVALTSGGQIWRRKRGNAERLQPMAEDATTTTQLFALLPPGTTAYEPLSAQPEAESPPRAEPLLRYEWRTAAGDVLVVEAAWPNDTGSDPLHVDLRPPKRSGKGPTSSDQARVVRLESPGA